MILSLFTQVTGKNFLYISKNEHNAQGKTAVKDSYGVWHVGNVYDSNDVSYGIAQNGIVEAFETKLVDTILSFQARTNGVVFFDVGANIGYYGLIAAKKFEAITHSFEPTPQYAENIREAATLNHTAAKVFVHNIALSNKAGEAIFHQSGSGSSLEQNFNSSKDLPTITVHTTPLDTIMVSERMPPPTFLKIDVEGHEWAVLEGAERTIATCQPIILLELCTTLSELGRDYINPHYEETLQFLEDNGYNVWHLGPNNTLLQWDRTISINHAGMFLCLHKSAHKEMIEIISKIYTIQN